MENEKEKDSFKSILNDINSKPLIIEKIFPYSLSRPNILLTLISKDRNLVNKLNGVFSKVSKYNSGLDKEFMDNLFKYSKIRELKDTIEKYYKKIQNSNLMK